MFVHQPHHARVKPATDHHDKQLAIGLPRIDLPDLPPANQRGHIGRIGRTAKMLGRQVLSTQRKDRDGSRGLAESRHQLQRPVATRRDNGLQTPLRAGGRHAGRQIGRRVENLTVQWDFRQQFRQPTQRRQITLRTGLGIP